MLLLHCHRISTPQCRVVIYCTRGRGRSHHLSACSRTAESNKCESAVGVTTRRGCERCRNANGPEQKKNGRYNDDSSCQCNARGVSPSGMCYPLRARSRHRLSQVHRFEHIIVASMRECTDRYRVVEQWQRCIAALARAHFSV